MERPVARCEEEGTLNSETTDGLIDFHTESYLAKQSRVPTSLCMQVFVLVWFWIALYAIATALRSLLP